MVGVVSIVPPRNAQQIIEAYFRYLVSLEGFQTELAATRPNAELFCRTVLIPAWEKNEPVLFAVCDSRIIGATFTTLPDPAFEYRVPYALGHGTWVAEDMRRYGVARLLLNKVREMLIERGVKRQMGMAHRDNEISKDAFGKMGFRIHGYVLSYDL